MTDTAFNSSAPFLDNVLTIKHFFERNDGPAFLFAVADSFHVRQQVNESVIDYCKEQNKTIGAVELIQNIATGFLTQLRQAQEVYKDGMILTNLDALINDTEGAFAADFNQMREGLIALGIPLFIWLSKRGHDTFIQKAIDLYLRRDLSTLFFEEPAITNNSGFIERFTESAKESANFEETCTRIALLEQQLAEARTDGFSTTRLANEIVLPLIKAYVENGMLFQAKELLSEFEYDFDYNKADADSIVAKLFEKTGDFSQAIEHYEKALTKNKELFGEDDHRVALIYNNLGTVWKNKGDLNKSIDYCEKAVKIDLKLFGEENSDIATYYNNIGTAWQDKGDLEKATEYLELALKIDLKLFGNENQNIAVDYNNLGSIWSDMGDLNKSIEYYEKALKIDQNLFGEENQKIAIRYNNLGYAWSGKGDLDKAIEYYEKALKIDLRLFGDDNAKVANRYNNLGMAWEGKGNYNKAMEYLEKACKILNVLHGKDDPATNIVMQNIEFCVTNNAKK